METEHLAKTIPMELSAETVKFYMNCDKILPSAQGMAIYGDHAFMLYHTGRCAVYDLVSRQSRPVAEFWLGSANEGTPSKEYANHSNQCMFSTQHMDGNELPLLYVTTGNGVGCDEDGFYWRCAVENIHFEHDGAGSVIGVHSELLQTYSYIPGGEEEHGWLSPSWGCPAWFVDSEKKFIYIHSAKYRTTKDYAHLTPENRYIITKFPMTAPEKGGFIKLTARDILDQFIVPFDIRFTQGGTLKDDKIYYTFGFGDEAHPDGLRVYDLKERRCTMKMDLKDSVLGHEEVECCAFYGDELLCNTNAVPAKIYSLGRLF